MLPSRRASGVQSLPQRLALSRQRRHAHGLADAETSEKYRKRAATGLRLGRRALARPVLPRDGASRGLSLPARLDAWRSAEPHPRRSGVLPTADARWRTRERADRPIAGVRATATLPPAAPLEADNWFHRLTEESGDLVDKSQPSSTLEVDRRSWARWVEYTERVGVRPARLNVAANMGHHREAHVFELRLALNFIVYLAREVVKPRSTDRPRAKPQSSMNVWYGVQRRHWVLFSTSMVKSKMLTLQLRGMYRECLEAYGAEFFAQERKEPFTPEDVRAILNVPRDAVLVAGPVNLRRGDGASETWTNWAALVATCNQAGFRKAEIAKKFASDAFDAASLSRWHLSWLINGAHVADPDPAQLAGLRDGDMAVIKPPPAKNDPFGIFFGSYPIYLPWLPDNDWCAAGRLRELERRFPVRGQARRITPLFTIGSNRPFYASFVDTALRNSLLTFMAPAKAKDYSAHSFRIGLACALRAAGHDDATIQALCRWRSAASARLYGRLNPSLYAGYLKQAATAAARTPSRMTANMAMPAGIWDVGDRIKLGLQAAPADEFGAVDPQDDCNQN